MESFRAIFLVLIGQKSCDGPKLIKVSPVVSFPAAIFCSCSEHILELKTASSCETNETCYYVSSYQPQNAYLYIILINLLFSSLDFY